MTVDPREIAALRAELAQLRQRFDQLVQPEGDRPWMKLTAGPGTGGDALNYAWTEVAFDSTAGFYERLAHRKKHGYRLYPPLDEPRPEE